MKYDSKLNYDPKYKDFDPSNCWNADCEYIDEMMYKDEDGEMVYDGLACFAPYELECPIFKKKIEEDLEI